MGRVGRRPAMFHGGGDGERIVAFAQGGKSPGKPFFGVPLLPPGCNGI